MIAVNTNVLVRYVINDDPDQAQRAVKRLAGPQAVFIPHSVLLEMEWVLRAVYELDRAAILTAFRQVLGANCKIAGSGGAASGEGQEWLFLAPFSVCSVLFHYSNIS